MLERQAYLAKQKEKLEIKVLAAQKVLSYPVQGWAGNYSWDDDVADLRKNLFGLAAFRKHQVCWGLGLSLSPLIPTSNVQPGPRLLSIRVPTWGHEACLCRSKKETRVIRNEGRASFLVLVSSRTLLDGPDAFRALLQGLSKY